MSKVLVIAEHDGRRLSPSTARVVSCARQVPDAEVTVVVFGAEPAAIAAEAAALTGVAHVLAVADARFAHPLAAVLAPEVVRLAAGYTHVFGGSTTFGKDLVPRVAALLGVPQISDAMLVESATRFKRPIYAGNAIITVEVAAGRKVLATVRTASFEATPQGGTATVSTVAAEATAPGHTRFVSLAAATSDRPDLQSAARVVSGGRALASKENFALIFGLADRMGAAVGASRAAVDAGYAPNELQVGQTGKIIAPELYVAIGISGAIQHLTGIKDAKTIVAINKDAEAPIFEVADIGLVGDLFQVVPELEKVLAG
jgi:electron transfer flavoprotein alpha subunit